MPPKKVVNSFAKKLTPSPKKATPAAPKSAGKSNGKKGGGGKGAQHQGEDRSPPLRKSAVEADDEGEDTDTPEAPTNSPNQDTARFTNSPSPKRNSVAKPSLAVRYEVQERSGVSSLEQGLVRLRHTSQFCDVTVISSSGRIPVHRTVLAAHSDKLASILHVGQSELDLQPASQEAVDIVVRWLYGEISPANFQPSTLKVNEEVLRITFDLALPLLAELCAMRLAEATNSSNLVASVRLCEDFGLPTLREKFVAAAVADPISLDVIARDPATLGHPALMRELLAGIAAKAE